MSYETVHTIGTTVYFVFFLLFLWAMRVPRTNPGAGWWAVAMLFALSARLALIVLLEQESQSTISVYSALNVVEKTCLVIGMVRFFNIPVAVRGFWWALVLIEVGIVLVWISGTPSLIRGAGWRFSTRR